MPFCYKNIGKIKFLKNRYVEVCDLIIGKDIKMFMSNNINLVKFNVVDYER